METKLTTQSGGRKAIRRIAWFADFLTNNESMKAIDTNLLETGDYEITCLHIGTGRTVTLLAWFNAGSSHWIAGDKEIGWREIVEPPGETGNWTIIFVERKQHESNTKDIL